MAGLSLGTVEGGDGLEVGGQLAEKPNEVEVAPGLLFQEAARADAVEVAVVKSKACRLWESTKVSVNRTGLSWAM